MQAFIASDYTVQAKLFTGDTVWIHTQSPEYLQQLLGLGSKTGSVYGCVKDSSGNLIQQLIVNVKAIVWIEITTP